MGDIGCNRAYESQIGKVIPETDNFCWELTKFGYTEGDNDEDNDEDSEDNDEDDNEDSEDNDEDCKEDKATKFFVKYNKKKDKDIFKTCKWLQKQRKKKQKKMCKKIGRECPVTCNKC